ncbi:hypothetical protein DL93DRAFT_2059384, partial [Clavulina sp. PMI_390]
IFVGNLAYATNDEGLKTLFAGVVSDILSAQVIQRGSRSAGYGFVTVQDVASVEKAVAALNKKELDGREIIVEAAKPPEDKEKERSERRTKKRQTGRRGNKAPPGEVTEAEANGEAAPATTTDAEGAATEGEGEAKTKKRNKRSKAPVEGEAAETPAAATTEGEEAAAPAAPKKEKKPRKPRAPRPPRPEGSSTEPAGEPSKSVVFVANLAFNVDDDALATLFKEAGINVVSARVVRRRFGQPKRSKGYGFVDVGDEEQQKKALEAFAGKEVNGREIAVKIAVSGPNGQPADGSGDVEAPAGADAPVPA